MAQEYWKADEANDIVQAYLKYHADLIGANLVCIFKEKASKSDGQPIVGKISKCSAKYHPLMEEPYDYIIELGADAWAELSNSQKNAWIDYLMEHAYGVESETTGEMSWKLRNPELMVFPSIIHRHGINWMPGLPKIATLNLQKAEAKAPVKVSSSTAPTGGGGSGGDDDASFDDLTAGLT